MSGTPSISKEAFNLSLKVAANTPGILSDKRIRYYQQNLDEIPKVLEIGFFLADSANEPMFRRTIDMDSVDYRDHVIGKLRQSRVRSKIDMVAANTMPRSRISIGKITVTFFQVQSDVFISPEDLREEYKDRGLSPVNPYVLAKINTKDLLFADNFPNMTVWIAKDSEWHYLGFNRQKTLSKQEVGGSANSGHGYVEISAREDQHGFPGNTFWYAGVVQ